MTAGLLKTKVYSKRHYALVMAFAIVLIGAIYVQTNVPNGDGINKNVLPAPTESPFARAIPLRLEIPAINLDATFVSPLDLLPDQTIAVPDSYTQVGWYRGGSTPGENGPAVILGHVDSIHGPAVFYALGQLREGDEIRVSRADGTIATFSVTKLKRYPQVNFPTLEVYGPTDSPTLRLVTCTGTFDRGVQKYSHNLVVYATLVLPPVI